MIEPGLNVPWDPEGLIAAKRTLGAVRGRIGWEDDWGFNELITLVSDMHKTGLNVMLCVTPGDRQYGTQRFIDFCVHAASLLDQARDILEVHNELNHKPFVVAPDPIAAAHEYVKVQTAVRAKYPKLRIIIGGMSPEGGANDARQFLPAMVRANSGVLTTDGFGMHPYEFPNDPRDFSHDWNPCGYLDTLDAIWRFVGRPNMPFHLTEFGAPSARSDLPVGVLTDPTYPTAPYRYTADMQQEWMVRYFEAFKKSKANIVSAQWFNLNDGATTGTAWEEFLGLRRKNDKGAWTWKPAARTFRAWANAYR